jgi:hypothetical protein
MYAFLGAAALGTAVLAGLLVFAIWYVADLLVADGFPPVPLSGWLALLGGALFTLLLGAGLITLMLFSHRYGYDDLTIDPEDRKRN